MTDTGEDEPDGKRPEPSGQASPYHVSRAAAILIALALALGLLVGRASVRSDSTSAPSSTPSPSVAPAASVTATRDAISPTALRQTGSRCSQQKGDDLVLAVEVRNATASPVILEDLRVALPKSGLTQLATGVGACGELDVPNLAGLGLPAGGTVWLSTTVRVGVKCPASLSVGMTAELTDQAGTKQAVDVGGFASLKPVPWSGCSAAAPKR